MSNVAKYFLGGLAVLLTAIVATVFVAEGMEAGIAMAVIAGGYGLVMYARLMTPAEVWEEMAKKHSRFY